MMKIDKKDKIILFELHKNPRISLTLLAKKAGLSIDSTKKRMDKMLRSSIFRPISLIRHRNCGFKNVVNVMIKLQNINTEKYNRFIEFLRKHDRVTEIFSVSGEWDLSIVFIAKDAIDQDDVAKQIRHRFGDIIQSWSESLTTKCYKFEEHASLDFLDS